MRLSAVQRVDVRGGGEVLQVTRVWAPHRKQPWISQPSCLACHVPTAVRSRPALAEMVSVRCDRMAVLQVGREPVAVFAARCEAKLKLYGS